MCTVYVLYMYVHMICTEYTDTYRVVFAQIDVNMITHMYVYINSNLSSFVRSLGP